MASASQAWHQIRARFGARAASKAAERYDLPAAVQSRARSTSKAARLREHFADLVEYLSTVSDARRRALIYFASATRRQFYFDGNKRTARLMMVGELMSNSYDLVSVPYSRKLEFNNALDVLFDQDDATELLRFLSTCTLPG
jgi:hypothetical protein